jgi:membrane protease YdiL (CAAX protease family)
MRPHGIAYLDKLMKPIYQAVRFTQALASSGLVLALGVVIYVLLGANISLVGNLGWWSILLGIVAGGLTYGLVYCLTKVFWMDSPPMRELMEKLASLFRDFSWPSILVISLMAGLSEELLLRGLLQNWLVEIIGPAGGIAVASLVFGLMHYLSRTYVLVTFTLGLFFGIAYYLSNSLLFVIIAHAVYDVFAFAVLVKYPHLLGIKVARLDSN